MGATKLSRNPLLDLREAEKRVAKGAQAMLEEAEEVPEVPETPEEAEKALEPEEE